MCKCLECGREFTNMNSLSRHIRTHMTQEEYFDKYMRTSEQEGKCVICGKPTRFRNFQYANCCSQSCRNTWINQNRTEEERQLLNAKISEAHQLEETKEKTRQTNIERYGVPYTTQNEDVQEKRKQTCLDKYGVECSFQNEEVKSKIQHSIHQHYGEKGLGAEEITNKKIATNQQKYGCDFVGQSEEIKEKIKETCRQKFGVDYSWQAEEVKEKIKNTKKERYNDENYNNSYKAKETCLERYNVDNPQKSMEIREKTKQTMKSLYGSEYPLQNEEIREKMYKTLWANGGYHRTENRCYEALLKKYPNAKREYKSEKYPYKCDFYIPDEDLYIELNAFYMHGGHYFDKNNPEDIKKVEEWQKQNTEQSLYAIKIWTQSDLEKKHCAEENQLNYRVFWSEEQFMDWLKG